MSHKYGWKPDIKDFRDQYYEPPGLEEFGLVTKIDLRSYDTPIYDQGQLGSCTANAVAAHLDFNRRTENQPQINPSRLFIYYNERMKNNTVDYDAGATIRDSVKEVKNEGAVPESEWPYDIEKFKVQPPNKLYKEAIGYEALGYQRVRQTLNDMKARLASHYPFVTGISIYESFESPKVAKTGIVPIPKSSESLMGGHAVMCLGFDDTKKHVIMRNSWGISWGDSGYFYLPYTYLLNPDLASDMWALTRVK